MGGSAPLPLKTTQYSLFQDTRPGAPGRVDDPRGSSRPSLPYFRTYHPMLCLLLIPDPARQEGKLVWSKTAPP